MSAGRGQKGFFVGRRKAREMVVQILYQMELTGGDAAQALDTFFGCYPCGDTDAEQFARRLVAAVSGHRREIDDLIVRTAANWSLERIPPVDRSVLRMAICEMLYGEDIPYRVTLNEAIELAKRFGTDKSGAFVNGVLDTVCKHRGVSGQD
jgi:N utilization substance protein B